MVSSSIYVKKNTGNSNIDNKDHLNHLKRITEKVEEEELFEDSHGFNRIRNLADSNRITLQEDGMGTWEAKHYPELRDSLQHNLDTLTENEIRIMEENELKESKFWFNELPPEDAE